MELGVLGPLVVTDGSGAPLAVGGHKERAVLAFLAVHAGQVVSEDRLVDAVWGDAPPRTAARTLHAYLSRLRKALAGKPGDGRSVLESHAGGWSLQLAPGELDVARVEARLEAGRDAAARGDPLGAALAFADALRAWRGRPLEEFADQPWAALEAARLEEVRQLIVEERIDAELACGRHAEMVAELEVACRAHPLRERPWRQRMLALYRSGRQAEALRVYQELRRTLGDELGIEPSPDVARLERAIEVHDPALQFQPTATPLPTATGLAWAEKPTRPRPLPLAMLALNDAAFVGRAAERAELDAAWKAVQSGRLEVTLVAGEPGIGKTALAVRAAEAARREGAVVLFGRCDEESMLPFQPFVEAIADCVESMPAEVLRLRLGAQAADLALLVPGLIHRLPELAATSGTGAETQRYRVFEAASALLTAIGGEAPVVLVLDDLHWADRPTLQLLAHVVRRCRGVRMLMLGTYRDTDLVRTHPLAQTLADLRRAYPVTRVLLRGLSEDDVVALVAGGAAPAPPDIALASALWRETEGSPLFLREILRHLDETGSVARDEQGRWVARRRIDQLGMPEGVKEVIGRRLTRLSDAANTALRTGSVLGREIRLDVLEAVTDLSVDELLDAFDEATAAGVVDELSGRAGRWAFTHALVRQALYDELSLTRRVRLHHRVGDALEALQGPTAGPHLAELAFHFSQAAVAGGAGKAIEYARRAGEYALTLTAYEEAARQFAAAAEVADDAGAGRATRADLLLAQGDAECRFGDIRVARATFERVVTLIETADPERLARAALGYAAEGMRPIWIEIGAVNQRAVHLLEVALMGLPDGDSVLRARLLGCLAQELYFLTGADRRRDQLTAEALAMARRLGDPTTLTHVLLARTMAMVGPDTAAEAVANASEMLQLARSLGDGRLEAQALRCRIWASADVNEMSSLVADLDRWTALVEEMKDPVARGVDATLRGGLAAMEGRFDESEALINEGFRRLQQARDPNSFAPAVSVLFLRLFQGRIAEIVTPMLAAAEAYPELKGLTDALLAAAFAETGMRAEAQAYLDRVDPEDLTALPRNVFWLVAMGLASRACYRLGDRAKAETLYRLLLPHAQQNALMVTVGLGSVRASLGLVAAAAGRLDDAVGHLEAALRANAANGWRAWVTDTELFLAAVFADRDGPGDRERAVGLVDAAMATARELGMAGVCLEATDLHHRLHGGPAKAEPRRRPAVTRRDRARAKLTSRSRAVVAYWTRHDTDDELVGRFASDLGQRALFGAMARAFQPAMAFGFDGDVAFELRPPVEQVDHAAADWWTIEIRGRRATARRGHSDGAAVTIHIGLADFVRFASGELHPVRALIEGTLEVDGDFMVAARLPDMFGAVEPLEGLAHPAVR